MHAPVPSSAQVPARSDQAPVVSAQGLRKAFGDFEVLRGASLTLQRQENVAVLGKSGTGKSVFIKCLVGLIRPDDGTLRVLDEDVLRYRRDREWTPLRRRVGYLFQGGALYDAMTVRENMEFPLRRLPDKPGRGEIRDTVEEMLDNVGLLEAINKMPAELSGGMKKRIALARTLVLKPEIMLYDEPTTGLDPVTSKEISRLINEMQKKYGISSVIITHDIACVKITADRIAMLRDGQFQVEGTYDELKSSDDAWVRSFFRATG